MMYKINSYFAVLIITIFGAGASLIIIHVADSTTFSVVYTDNSIYTNAQ